MDKTTVEIIINLLEENYMFDAAIQVLKFEGQNENLIDYFRFLKGEEVLLNLSELNDERKNKVDIIRKSRREANSKELIMVSIDEDKSIDKISSAADCFNNGDYILAEKLFREGYKVCQADKRPVILTYICLCQYKQEQHVEALKTINEAIDLELWNDSLKLIRNGIIDRLSGIESKNKFIEEYYTKGTVVGEILRHSLELYQKIDNIEMKNKNIFSRMKEFVSEARKLFDDEKQSLEKDIQNIEQYILKGEKQISLYLEDEEIKNFVKGIEKFKLSDANEKVFRIAETLYARLENGKDVDMDYSHLVFLYSKGVEMLCRERILPYFNKSREGLPILESRDDYNRIGIRSFDVGGLVRFNFNNSFNINSSMYLQEIIKNNLLRKEFKGREHLMPWDKLKFISYCIKTGKDPIDGTKSAGVLLLFYCCYRNFLNINKDLVNNNELVVLAGNLIRLQNERNSLIHSKIIEDMEWIKKYREISFDCVEKLCRIEAINIM